MAWVKKTHLRLPHRLLSHAVSSTLVLPGSPWSRILLHFLLESFYQNSCPASLQPNDLSNYPPTFF